MVVHRILAFSLLSLYIGLRDSSVCLCAYIQLAFPNTYLSTFSCIKKIFLNGFIEVAKGGFDMSGRVSRHFDNNYPPLVCLIVMLMDIPAV